MPRNPFRAEWGAGMTRSALGVTSDILVLKILINDAVKSLQEGSQLAQERRQSLSKSFHRYIENKSLDDLKPSAISKLRRGVRYLTFYVVRTEAANDAPKLLAVIDKFASPSGQLEAGEKTALVEFLSRVDTALDRSRANIPIGRYL